jgi:hypothetical protein
MAYNPAQLTRKGIQPFGGTNFNAPQVIATIAALRALSVAGLVTNAQISLAGIAAQNDGGQGMFVYNSAAAGADDGVNLIQPTVGVGRWIRLNNTSDLVVQTVAAIRSLSVTGLTTGAQVSLTGTAAANDGGQGMFYYNSVSALADDGANVIAPTVGVGRWIRLTNPAVPPVATIAALRALSVAGLVTGFSITLLGYYAVGDGGGGLFAYNSGSAVADNNGTIIAPTVGAGRWLRIFDGNTVNVHWFGAKGDGATDDRIAIQAAIDYISVTGRGTVWLNEKIYFITDYLTMNANWIALRGKGRWATRIVINHASNDGIRVGVGAGPTISVPQLSDFSVSRNMQPTGGTGIALYKTALAFLHDIHVDGCVNSFYFIQATNTQVARCEGSSNVCAVNYIGFHWDGGTSGTTNQGSVSSQMMACLVDATSCTATSMGLKIDGNEISDLYAYDFETLNCSYGKYVDGTLATNAATVAANGAPYNWDIMFMDCTDDQFGVHGTLIFNNGLIGAITIKSGWTNPGAGAGVGSGIYVLNSIGVTIDGVQLMNIGQLATSRGITIDTSQNVRVQNCQFIDQNFAVVMTGASLSSIDGNTFKNQSTRVAATQINASTSSLRNQIINNTLCGYATTGIADDATCSKQIVAMNIIDPTHVATPIALLGTADVTANNIIT